jgi:ABC-type multidrug transport system ATPase subunit
LGDVERFCRQIVVLDRGTVVRAGTMDEMRAQIANRYEISWSGEVAPYRAALTTAGVQLADAADEGQNKVMIVIPPEMTTRGLFELARNSGAVLTELKADEENLERLFFRVTRAGEPAAVS